VGRSDTLGIRIGDLAFNGSGRWEHLAARDTIINRPRQVEMSGRIEISSIKSSSLKKLPCLMISFTAELQSGEKAL
jgi:hypothetical protein